MKYFILFALVISNIHLARALPPPPIDPKKDYWKNSGLVLVDFVKAEVPSCTKDYVHIYGCVEALNAIAMSLEPKSVFATSEEKESGTPYLGELIKIFPGGLNLYAYQAPKESDIKKKDIVTLKKEDQAEKAKRIESMKLLAKQKNKLNFQSIFNEMIAQAEGGKWHDSESSLAADVFNADYAIVKDPHTLIWSEEMIEAMGDRPEVSFAGIGAQMLMKDKNVMIVNNLKDSPALKAGLHIGDILISVDGKSAKDQSLDTIISWVRGTEDIDVTLVIERDGKELSFTITRKKQIIPANVTSTIVNHNGTPYGYITLEDFMEEGGWYKIYSAVKNLKDQGAKGLILDLRNNGGGLLPEAANIAALFMGMDAVTLKQMDLETNKMTAITNFFNATGRLHIPVDSSTPMVTLINGDSASASEIVSGALQDSKRSWIVGDRSFGKATVQMQVPFTKGGSPSKIKLFKTVARFYQPSGRTNQIVGILPDFYVDPIPNATELDRYVEREEDQYAALPPLGKPWVQPRPDAVKAINDCKTASGHADENYRTQKAAAITEPDYQLLVAEDILDCAFKFKQ